jgi:hypothetical protein
MRFGATLSVGAFGGVSGKDATTWVATPGAQRRWYNALSYCLFHGKNASELAPRGLRCHPRRMIDDPDIWRAANLLVRRHGTDAAHGSAQRADDLFNRRDVEGYVVWRRILEAAAELTCMKRAEGERMN